jgi:hypothetical protein
LKILDAFFKKFSFTQQNTTPRRTFQWKCWGGRVLAERLRNHYMQGSAQPSIMESPINFNFGQLSPQLQVIDPPLSS